MSFVDLTSAERDQLWNRDAFDYADQRVEDFPSADDKGSRYYTCTPARDEGIDPFRDWRFCGTIEYLRDYFPSESEECLTKSNIAAIRAELDRVDPDGYDHCETKQWLNPNYDLWIVAGSESARAYDVMMSCLADYPVLDEDDFCTREYEASLIVLTQCYNVPEERAGDVLSYMQDSGTGSNPDDIHHDDVTEALEALGLTDNDE